MCVCVSSIWLGAVRGVKGHDLRSLTSCLCLCQHVSLSLSHAQFRLVVSTLSCLRARPASSASSSVTLLYDASDDKEHGESSECSLTPRHAAHTISLPSLDAPRFQRVRRVEPSTGPPQSTLMSLVPRVVSAWWTLCSMCGCGDAFTADGFQTCS